MITRHKTFTSRRPSLKSAMRETKTPASKTHSLSQLPAKPCPICGKPADAALLPFCSQRCADLDLHRWLGGYYAIPGEAIPAKDKDN